MSGNYYRKLSVKIITGNYQLVYYVAEKCVNYRDTGVSNKLCFHQVVYVSNIVIASLYFSMLLLVKLSLVIFFVSV